MKTLEYNFVDKSTWGPGPWQDEPDKRQWLDQFIRRIQLLSNITIPSMSLPCLIVRHDSVHYGHSLTSLREGEEDSVWWLGFDCAPL